MSQFYGRKSAYTDRGISRVKCTRCGAPASQQWQVCANGRWYAGICDACDVALNAAVLEFMAIPNRDNLIRNYRAKMAAK